MPRGRHRVEPVERPLPRRLRQIPRPIVATGVGAALLGVTLAVTLWPGSSSPSVQVVVSDEQRDSALAADALTAASALRRDERSSRDRSVGGLPTTPSALAATAPPETPATETLATETLATETLATEILAGQTSAGQTSPGQTSAAAQPARLPKVIGTLWVSSDVNVRSGPSVEEDRIGGLTAITRVDVTGATKNGWTQVVTGKRAGWVRSTFLSKTKPAPVERTPSGVSSAACSISPSIEKNLKSNARAVYRAVCAAYGSSVSSFGGYRPGDDGDHGTGRAVDIMVSGAPGTQIARYVQTHARELGVSYVIWEQRIWMAGDPASQWKAMEDRGGATANHFDHVHVSVA